MKSILISVLILFSFNGCIQQLESRLDTDITSTEPLIPQGDYLGQTPPGNEPLLFAPGIISNGLINRDITISPDENNIYFTSSTPDYSFATIFCIKRDGKYWNKPEVVTFGKEPAYTTIEPCLNTDGTKLYFVSNKPVNDTSSEEDMNIWMSEKNNETWNEPKLLGEAVNSKQGEFYPTVTKNGTLYFTREEENRVNYIYRSKLVDNKYTKPEKLPDQVNCGRNRFNAYISPDESFIIIPATGVENNVTGANYYISFRNENDEWTEPINMGEKINTNLGRGWSASLSPDGKYLFFMSSKSLQKEQVPDELSYDFFDQLQTQPQNGNSDVYWISADVINNLKSRALSK
jgi:Tol biopolymer transport system component